MSRSDPPNHGHLGVAATDFGLVLRSGSGDVMTFSRFVIQVAVPRRRPAAGMAAAAKTRHLQM